MSEKRNNDHVAMHVEFSVRKSMKSAFIYPWERGFHNWKPPGLEMPAPKGFMPLISLEQDAEEPEPKIGPVDTTIGIGAKYLCKQPLIEWEAKLCAQRDAAIRKWLKLVLLDPLSFQFARDALCGMQHGHGSVKLRDDLINIFSNKSTSTLQGRISPLARYADFVVKGGAKPFPVTEARIYMFMQSEELTSAPTFLKSLVSSLAFAWYTLGLSGADVACASTRIRGLATKCYLAKKKTQSRDPLTVGEMQRLEAVVNGDVAKSPADRHAAGCFLFMCYARARFSDMMAVESLELDTFNGSSGIEGFIEAKIARSKTSFSAERRVRMLPMSATVNGLSAQPWGVAWIKNLAVTGVAVAKGKPLLPARTRIGWHTLPMSAEAATSWLRSLIQTPETVDRMKRVGTHSCKATCLSWLAKAGADADTRRLMGYHIGERMSTMFIYGRENTAEGLRQLQSIINKIRAGEFFPDTTKSGYFVTKDAAGNSLEQEVEEISESSSEGSSDEDEPEHEKTEKAEHALLGPWDAGVDTDKLPQEAVYFKHNISRIVHFTEDESGLTLACGRDVTAGYMQLRERPEVMHPVCKQCFARFAKG